MLPHKEVLENMPEIRTKYACGERMIGRSFEPGFRICHQQKDLNVALQSARSLGLSLPGTAIAQEMLNAVAAQGGSNLDHSAMVLALEALANHEV